MQGQSTDNVDKLKKFFEDQKFEVEETSNGMRIRLSSGIIIEVNALIRDSDFFWASFETSKKSPEKLKATLDDISNSLSRGLLGLATLGEFEKTQDSEDKLVFVANIELLPSVVYQGVAVLGDEPVQSSRADQVPKRPEPVESVQTGHVHKRPEPSQSVQTGQVSKRPEPVQTAPTERVHKRPKPEPESASVSKSDTPSQPPVLITAEMAVESLESVDGKMLRECLDMMNLRRSSNIRMAMTRIFRSALDPVELLSAIHEEAGKITTQEDLQELEMVRIVSANGFLQPLVDLLCQEVEQKK